MKLPRIMFRGAQSGGSIKNGGRLDQILKIISEVAATDSGYCAVLHSSDELTLPEMENEFRLYGEKAVDRIAEIFRIYTGHPSSACIKACNLTPDVPNAVSLAEHHRSGDPPFVYTFWRDSSSVFRRDAIDSDPNLAVYPLNGNTGLLRARQNGYWFCNHLQSLGEEYRSENAGWSRYYNATCVVCIAPPCEGRPINPLGFLCIDNMGGGFDDSTCRHIMNILGNLLHYSMWMTAEIAHRKGKDDDDPA
ncbi:MAG: hypothetical protein QOJ27_2842 [Sphingomonadales bacterium]|nr:hypothetical protein [Sphingomonadales bacterium]